ncbi:MAG: hypothetical protein ACOYLV_02905 [Rubrivivax sp.]
MPGAPALPAAEPSTGLPSEPVAPGDSPADIRGRFLAHSRLYLLEMPVPQPGAWLLVQPDWGVTRSRGARR